MGFFFKIFLHRVLSDRLLGRIAAEACDLKILKGEDISKVRYLAIKALDKYKYYYTKRLFGVICEINNQFSKEAFYYRLLFHVKLHESHQDYPEIKGYYVNYDVVADSPGEAVEYVKEFESDSSCDIFLENSEKIEPRPDGHKGVYWRSNFFYYENEE